MHRFIPIEGVHNFRDFGGYDTKTGLSVKKNKLFRAGQFANLTDNGRESLNQIGPKLVVDLRRAKEREEQPGKFGTLELRQIIGAPKHDNGTDLPPHLAYLRDDEVSFDATFAHMIDTYKRMPDLDEYKYLFFEAFCALANQEVPLIVHCAAGKDRTGVLCALILDTLEVDRPIIMEDYLLTNKTPNLDRIIEGYAKKLSEKFGRNFDAKDTYPMGAVYAEYLETAFETISRKYGGISQYLESIGVDEAMKKEIRSHLVSN